MQVFMVTGLFAGQHNTKLHGTITGVIYLIVGSAFAGDLMALISTWLKRPIKVQ